jgi:fructose-1,6-bisphosphatase II / sedoheptulose-1,7-bisphosphatase
MSIDKNFLDKFMKATEFAAFGASPFIGKGDKIAADQGAVDNMRAILNQVEMNATIVIGEGEMDEAPMLHIGEKVGTKSGPEFDIAVDPLEGTNFTAKGLPNACFGCY